MSHSLPPKSERSSQAPDLPTELASALDQVRADHENVEAWEELNERAREFDRPDEVAALYTEVLASELTPVGLEDVGRLAADFCEEWYEDTAPVLEMLTSVLDVDPTQSWAFERLTVLLTVAAEWDSLLSVYDKALAATEEPEKKQALLEEAAKVARDFAGKPQRASDYLKELLLARLDDDQLAATLERRLDEQGRHNDLIDIWTARLAVVPSDVGLKTRIQIASRHLESLGDAESSLLTVDDFLEAGGKEFDACEVLEKVADTQDAEKEVRREALKRLDTLHARAERFLEVISATERALALAEGDEDRIALHRRAVELLVRIENPEHALAHCAAILKLNAMAEDVRVQARALAESVGQLDRFADAVVAAAANAESGERRVELLVEAAHVMRYELAQTESAIELYFSVEKDDDSDEAARLLACQELSSLLEEAARSEELLAILETRSGLETKAEEKSRILGQAAKLSTVLGQKERALGLWSQRLQDDPSDDDALSARIELFSELNEYSGLVETLEARSTVGSDPTRQREDLVRAAGVFSDRLKDLQKAIATWQKVEERFRRVPETLDALVELCAQAEHHQDVVTLLSEGIEAEVETDRLVAQLSRLGDTQRRHLHENEAALSAYRKALAIAPRDEASRSGLRAFLENVELAHDASEVLVDALRRAEDYSEVVELVETRIAASKDREFQSDILLEAAEIEERAENPIAALNALARAFGLVPASNTETELHRLAEKIGDWDTAARAYGDAISRLEDGELAGALYLSRGKVEEDRLQRPDAATRSYREAVTRAPSEGAVVDAMVRAAHRASLFGEAAWALVENSRALDRVSDHQLEQFALRAEEHGDWRGVLEGLADQIAAASDLSAQVAHDLKSQLAIWYRDQVSDLDAAERVLQQAVKDFPQESSLRILADLQRRAPGAPLVVTLVSLADVCGDDLAVLREAGDVALCAALDSELAEPILERSLRVASARFVEAGGAETDFGFEASDVCAWATDHLVTLALASHRASVAVQLLEGSALLPFDGSEQVARRFRAAQVASDAELDEKAVELCEAVLAVESNHDGAITLLSGLHEKSGRLDELLELRRRELALDRDQDRRLFLRLDQSRVLGAIGAEAGERVEVLRENLADRPGHADSIEALASLLTAEETYTDLAAVLETQAAAIVDDEPKRAAGLWERAGTLCDEQLDDEDRLAVDFQLSAAAHASVPVLDRLALISAKHENWEREVSWLQLRLSLTAEVDDSEDGPGDRREVVVRLGHAHLKSQDRAAAREHLEMELEKDPPADEARQLLARIYRELEEWKALSNLLAAGVEYAPSDEAKVIYLRGAAQVERRQLGDLEAAIPFFEQAIDLDGDDRGLRLLLADTLRNAERYDAAAQILSTLLEEFGRRRTKERAVVHTQLARIARATGDLDEALEQAEAAAKIERTDATILMLVGQLARQKGQLDRAEQAYRTLALIASRKTGSTKEVESDEVGESSILFELYRIALERGDESQARELLDSALEVATREPSEALRLAESLLAADQIDLLLDALKQRLDSGIEGELAARMLVTRANVLERCGREEEALEARLQALSWTPADERLIETTQKLAERCEGVSKFWAHIIQLAERYSNDPTISGDLLFRAGLAAETRDQDLKRAAELFELAQRTGYRPKRIFQAIDRVLDAEVEPQRMQKALSEFVSSEGAENTPDVFSDALYRLAEFELGSGLLEEGASHLMRALEVEAQDERALLMLEPVVRGGATLDRVLILFLRVCRKAADAETLLYAFRQASKAQTVERSVLEEAIALARSQDHGEALRELLSRVIELAEAQDELSSVRELLVERASLARNDEEYSVEAELLERVFPQFEGEDRFELELRLAICMTEDLGRSEEGQATLERLLADFPHEARVWRPLLVIYRDADRVDAVEQLIEAIEEHITDDADRETLKLERVRLMVNAGRLEEAEEQLRDALSVRPDMTEAASILATLLRKAERWGELKELVESLFNEAKARKDGALAARYGLELARLVVQDDREEAMNVLNTGLSLASDSRDYLLYLLGLYSDEDNQSERADAMERLLSLEVGSSARELSFQLADLRATLGDEYGVGRALELGVRVAPEEPALISRYIEHLRQGDDHARLAEALCVSAAQAGKTEMAAELFAEAARIYDESLGESEKAAQACDRAFECDPTNLLHLEKSAGYLVVIGDVDGALERLSGAIDRGDEMALADLLELRANIVVKERMSDREAMAQAARDLKRALEQLIPEDQEETLQIARIQVLTELRSLYQSDGEDALERDVVLELADLTFKRQDAAGGIDVLASWVREHEKDAEVAALLGSKATEVGDHSAAMFAYQTMWEASEDANSRAVLLLADAAEAAGQPQEARSALEQAFANNAADPEVLGRLRTMYEKTGAYHELANILMNQAEKAEEAEAKAALLVEVGDLYVKAGDGDAACGVFEDARELTENPYLIIAKLANAYLASGEVERAETSLNEAVASHGKRRSPQLSLLQHGLAQVAEAQGNPDAMFAWLEAALMSDRNNGHVARELAVRAQEQQRFDIAIKALQSLTLSKVEGPMSKAEAYFRQAQIASEQGDAKKALLMARRAHNTDPQLPGVELLLSELGA